MSVCCELSIPLIVLVLTILFLIYWYMTTPGLWTKCKVPGPKPIPFFGNFPQLTNGFHPVLHEWGKTYGRTFGTYRIMSKTPTLVTSDLELIRKLKIDNFEEFNTGFPVIGERINLINKSIVFLGGNDWKRHRQIYSKFFSPAKLKNMMEVFEKLADKMVRYILSNKKEGKLFEAKKVCGQLTGNVIARVGFDLDASSFEENSEFNFYVNHIVNELTPLSMTTAMLGLFSINLATWFGTLSKKSTLYNRDAFEYFEHIAREGLQRSKSKDTKESSKGYKDMISTLAEKQFNGAEETHLNQDEIIADGIQLMFAAYDSTSSLLSSAIYFMARHQHVQNKVKAEIDKALEENGNVLDFNLLSKLQYTEQVLFESLRLVPPFPILMISCKTPTSHKNMTIPAGVHILFPVYEILHDPEYWQEPETFDPDRFDPKNKDNINDLNFIVFGCGPRKCPGMRMALTETKVALVKLLTRLQFVLTENTEPKIGCDAKFAFNAQATLKPEKEIKLDVIEIKE